MFDEYVDHQKKTIVVDVLMTPSPALAIRLKPMLKGGKNQPTIQHHNESRNQMIGCWRGLKGIVEKEMGRCKQHQDACQRYKVKH
jgi:hypothetical protein